MDAYSPRPTIHMHAERDKRQVRKSRVKSGQVHGTYRAGWHAMPILQLSRQRLERWMTGQSSGKIGPVRLALSGTRAGVSTAHFTHLQRPSMTASATLSPAPTCVLPHSGLDGPPHSCQTRKMLHMKPAACVSIHPSPSCKYSSRRPLPDRARYRETQSARVPGS